MFAYRVRVVSTHKYKRMGVKPNTTHLIKHVKLINHNTTHLNKRVTWQDPHNPFNKNMSYWIDPNMTRFNLYSKQPNLLLRAIRLGSSIGIGVQNSNCIDDGFL
jgi:hypothetical protein